MKRLDYDRFCWIPRLWLRLKRVGDLERSLVARMMTFGLPYDYGRLLEWWTVSELVCEGWEDGYVF